MYLLFLAPAMILAMIAQARVKSAYAHASQIRAASGLTGAQAAQRILDANGMNTVRIERVGGVLSDHYDPRAKVLRLSQAVHDGASLASLGIAAHEAGHALQDAKGYAPLRLRNGIVPLASIGSKFSFLLIMGGFVLMSAAQGLGQVLIFVGIGLFSLTVLFQLINLPVEFDASARAKRVLTESGMIQEGAERKEVERVLGAAALTYVAATLSAIMTLLYFILRAGGNRG